MQSIRCLSTLLVVCASILGSRVAVAKPQLFVYKGAGCTGAALVPEFEAYLGRPTDGTSDFIAYGDWTELEPSARWIFGCWKKTGKLLSVSVPMLPKTGGTLQAGADGEYDNYFATLGRTIVEAGGKDAYLRIGLEFNGDWFPWAASKNPEAFKAFFARIVRALRATSGSNFKMVWNPNVGKGKIAPDLVYPGDEFVDIIGVDIYNQSWRAEDSDAHVRWNYMTSQPFGLNWLTEFAAKHRKRIAVPEWGTGVRPDGHGFADDPVFIQNMAVWIRKNNILFHSYWDYKATDYNAQLSTGQYPASARAFKKAFGRSP